VSELASSLGVARARVDEIAAHLITKGELQQVGGFYFSAHMIRKLEDAVVECAQKHGEVKIPEIRDTFSTSRKYLIPLMEYLDNTGLTRREGDRRFLKEGG
jgi:selenocysteine-specific elongation factor